jgi:hypothetical protein
MPKTLDDYEKVSDEKLDRLIEYKKEQIIASQVDKPMSIFGSTVNIFDIMETEGLKEELLALEELKFSRPLVGCGCGICLAHNDMKCPVYEKALIEENKNKA